MEHPGKNSMKQTFRASLLLLVFVGLAFAWTPFRNSAVTSAVTVQSTTTDVYGYYLYNPNASMCSLDFFNATSANVTLGTTVPILSFPVPATSAVHFFVTRTSVAHFQTALSVAAVTAAGGGTTCSTGMVVNLDYQN